MGRKVCHHSGKGCSQSTHICGDASSARSRRLACGLDCKILACHSHKPLFHSHLLRIFHQEFDNLLVRVERLQVVQAHALDGNLEYLVLGYSERPLLLLQIELSGINQHSLRYQAHDLGSRNLQASCRCGAAHFLVCLMKWCCLYIRYVHGYLCNAVFVYVPADSLAALERSRLPHVVSVFILEYLARKASALAHLPSLFPYVKCHGHSPSCRCCIQIIVNGHKEIPCSNVDGTALCNHIRICSRAKVRHPGRVYNLLRQSLVLSGTAYCKVLPFRFESGGLVAVARYLLLVKDSLCQGPGQLGTFLKSNS